MAVIRTGMGDWYQGSVVFCTKGGFQLSSGFQVSQKRPRLLEQVGWPNWGLPGLLFYCPLLAEFPAEARSGLLLADLSKGCQFRCSKQKPFQNKDSQADVCIEKAKVGSG